MARKQFSIHYPDGSKKHIGRNQRDEMLLGKLIVPIENNFNSYKYIGQKRTGHALSDLDKILAYARGQQRQEPDYYAGQFVFELGDRRFIERMESVEAMTLRLRGNGALQPC